MANNSFFDPLKSQLKNLGADLWSDTKDLFKNVFAGTDGPISMRPEYQTPSEALYYQIKNGDTDMASVANANNVQLDQLVSNNGGAQSLPPVGSFMALR